MSVLYDNIEILRNERNLTLQGVSDVTGVPVSTISGWKKNGVPVKSDNLEAMANYFDVSIDFLLGRTRNRFSHKSDLHKTTLTIIEAAEASNLDERDARLVVKLISAMSEEY